MRAIESLEHRCFLSASSLSAQLAVNNNPAVSAANDQVTTDRQKLADDATQAVQSRLNHHTSLKTIAINGKVTLATDKSAIKAATDDTAHDAAVATYSADKAKLKADLAAEKLAGKQDAATFKTTLHQDVAALKADFKTFKVTRKSIADQVKTGAMQFATAAKAAGADGSVTDTEIDQLATDVTTAINGATAPSKESVQTLLTDVKDAFSDKSISSSELAQLVTDVQAVATSANISSDEADAVFSDVKKIVSDLDLSADKLVKLGVDFLSLYLG